MTTAKHLLFVIDITGSMGQWITALSSLLPTAIQSLALTRVFDSLSILAYTDYDTNPVCYFSGLCHAIDPTEVQQLKDFASKLKPIGGGGHPEAFKTALVELISKKKLYSDGKLWILHLCDAPPHSGNLDSEGKKEKEALGDMFDYVKICQELTTQLNVSFSSLTTTRSPLYCYLAQLTGGGVYNAGVVSLSNIRNQIGRVMNVWFGFGDPITSRQQINLEHDNLHNENPICKLAVQDVNDTTSIPPDRSLSTALLRSVQLMKTDEAFLERVIQEFRVIIETSPMALTISPILGKMWREFCKRRSDIRRDELIDLLGKAKNRLDNVEKPILELWLKESYNAKAEIDAEIKQFLSKNNVEGLLRFLPEGEFHAQQIVQLLAAGDRKSTTVIRSMLTRMYVDTSYKLNSVVLEDDAELPLPDGTIPLNLSNFLFFELVMNTVAPGTKLTRRYAAMLAIHAIQCGSVLKERAITFLEAVKGKWISWNRRSEDNSPEIPDNWSVSFLDLITHPNCVDIVLTEDEKKKAFYFKKVTYLLRFFRGLELNVKTVDPTSIDGMFPDHLLNCPTCKFDRPLTVISSTGECGYCVSDSESKTTQLTYKQVRCYPCGTIYSRNSEVSIPGYSKCYTCRTVTEEKKLTPKATCSKCNLDFTLHYKTEEGLPNGVCANCAAGNPPRVLGYREYPCLAHQIFSEHFPTLCAAVGFKIVNGEKFTFNSGTALYDAVLYLEECEPVPQTAPTKILFRESLVQNSSDLWTYMVEVMTGGKAKWSECSICLEQLPPSELIPACGRRGCQQRVCGNCSQLWYSKNTPGSLIYMRAILCQFCGRVPAPRILGRIHNRLIALAQSFAQKPLNPDMYYAWCSDCLQPKEIAEITCTTEAPRVENYRCNDCVNPASQKAPERELPTKSCPGCTVTIQKTGGCNHITCSACSTHWCWQCGEKFSTSGEVYDHMHSVHGKIFDDDEAQYYNNEEYD
eukprot:TRINITY_DN7546_c0_g1_i1.p1 TRINITY_DN7546_c0_g1~~TRINITY_DN7546_c0_g1_i1.p1  ORF type:complete len:1000 (-),score=171.71 TRINITY_DN7546_c0_g1_i1:20-2932(-)